MKRIPKYCLHKPTGQARVSVNGKRIYLGKFNSVESRQRYAKIVAELNSTGHESKVVTLDELAIRYTEEAAIASPQKIYSVRAAMRALILDHGTLPTGRFTAADLKAIRNRLITEDKARRYINELIAIIQRAIRFGVVEGIVPSAVAESCRCLESLRAGKSLARETAPVEPAKSKHVAAIEPHVSNLIWSMVQVELLTGMRPGEVVRLKPCQVDTSGNVWVYWPGQHKTKHHGKRRHVMIPPAAQAVLKPYMDRDPQLYCFRPAESDRVVHRARVGECYRVDSYRNAIQRACDRAGVPRWFPNQLRHTFGTEVERQHGADAARVLLGHSDVSTTRIYAERDETEARRVAAKLFTNNGCLTNDNRSDEK